MRTHVSEWTGKNVEEKLISTLERQKLEKYVNVDDKENVNSMLQNFNPISQFFSPISINNYKFLSYACLTFRKLTC